MSAPVPRLRREDGRVLCVELGNGALHVEIAGEGAPVLLLHGFTGSTRTMDGVAAGLRDAGYRTVAIDAPGHGRSNPPDDVRAYTLEQTADAYARVLDAAGISRAVVVGYSMGGRAALGLAVRHPERVAALVLVGASAGLADPGARAARRGDDEALAQAILRDGVPAFVARWMANPLFATQARLGPAYLAGARAQRLANRAHGLALSLRGLGTGAQPPLHAALARLPIPTLLVVGDEDAKFIGIARELADLLPQARVARISHAGHAAHIERCADFLAEVRAFLASNAPDTWKGRS